MPRLSLSPLRAQQAIKDVNMQERALNILVSGLTGMAGAVITKEALSSAAEKMRDLMIEDSKKFSGVVDSTGKVLSNVSGPSEGVRSDGTKVGGTRVDLDLLCGADNSRCTFRIGPAQQWWHWCEHWHTHAKQRAKV